MDFALTEDQQALQRHARELLREQVTHAGLAELESGGWSVFDRELWARMGAAGLTGVTVPERHGGAGLGLLEAALVCEEVGRTVAPVPAVWTLAAAHALARDAPDALQAAVLPSVADGGAVLSLAVDEAGGAPVTAPLTTASPASGGGWRVSGDKEFVPFGAEADRLLVAAATDTSGLALFALRRDAAGVTVTEQQTTNRRPTATLHLAGAEVADADVVATGDAAQEAVGALLADTTALLCCVAAGVCTAALRMTAEYTTGREQFDKPVASFQAVGQRAADAFIDTEIVRLTAYQAAWRRSVGWPSDEEVAVAKFWAGDGGSRVVHACQHLHGGIGVDLDYPLHRYFLWVKQIEHELGTPTRELLTLGAMLAATPV